MLTARWPWRGRGCGPLGFVTRFHRRMALFFADAGTSSVPAATSDMAVMPHRRCENFHSELLLHCRWSSWSNNATTRHRLINFALCKYRSLDFSLKKNRSTLFFLHWSVFLLSISRLVGYSFRVSMQNVRAKLCVFSYYRSLATLLNGWKNKNN